MKAITFAVRGWLLVGAASYAGAIINFFVGEPVVMLLFAIHGVLCNILWAILK